MDRLSIVKTAGLLIAAASVAHCKSEGAPAQPPPSRVVAVQAENADEDPLPEFCDFLDADGNKKKPLHMPEVIGRVAGNATGYRWVNLWATWCKPCIEEMPTLVTWADRLNKAGVNLTLEFVSVDEDPEVLRRFYQTRPTFPTSSRLTDPEALAPWIAEIGLDSGAGLPIHIFADPSAMIRCARAAAINPSDFAAVERLVK